MASECQGLIVLIVSFPKRREKYVPYIDIDIDIYIMYISTVSSEAFYKTILDLDQM